MILKGFYKNVERNTISWTSFSLVPNTYGLEYYFICDLSALFSMTQYSNICFGSEIAGLLDHLYHKCDLEKIVLVLFLTQILMS